MGRWPEWRIIVRHWFGRHLLVDVWDSKTRRIVGKSCWLCEYQEP